MALPIPNLSLTGGSSSANPAAQFGNVSFGSSGIFWPSVAVGAVALTMLLIAVAKK